MITIQMIVSDWHFSTAEHMITVCVYKTHSNINTDIWSSSAGNHALLHDNSTKYWALGRML